MKKNKIKYMLLFAVCLMMLSFAGCKAGQDEEVSLAEGQNALYFLSSEGYSLKKVAFRLEASDPEGKMKEVMELLKTAPEGCKSVINAKTPILSYELEGDTVNINCSEQYKDTKSGDELLFRAAIVRSLTGVEGIKGVRFFVNSQPLVGISGEEVGLMDDLAFENSIDHRFAEYEATLYFADETGTKLVAEKRKVSYPVDGSKEYYVVQELIRGPEEAGHYPALKKEVKLLEASVDEGVCYLYFDPAFLNISEEVSAEVAIYSIVNTLTDLPGIGRVRFVVEGVNDPVYRNSLSLSSALPSNLDLIIIEKK